MNRILLTTIAGLMIAGPLSVPAFAQQGQQGQGRYQQGQQDNDRDRSNNNDHRTNDRNDNNGPGRNHRDASQYHDNRTMWRDSRRNARWNDQDHNGYYIGRSWHAGPPPPRAYRQRGFQLAYRPWQRGESLGYYNQRYQEVDYRAYNLQPPPRGYRWVQDDSGDLIMAALAGGLIAAIIANN